MTFLVMHFRFIISLDGFFSGITAIGIVFGIERLEVIDCARPFRFDFRGTHLLDRTINDVADFVFIAGLTCRFCLKP